MKVLKAILFFLFFPAQLVFSQESEQLELKVEITGMRYIQGQLMLTVYKCEESYLSPEQSLIAQNIQVTSQKKKVILQLNPGKYAIAVYHDANNNNIMDTNFFGIPTERYGFSNNQRGRFGAPSFEQVAFELKHSGQVHSIELR